MQFKCHWSTYSLWLSTFLLHPSKIGAMFWFSMSFIFGFGFELLELGTQKSYHEKRNLFPSHLCVVCFGSEYKHEHPIKWCLLLNYNCSFAFIPMLLKWHTDPALHSQINERVCGHLLFILRCDSNWHVNFSSNIIIIMVLTRKGFIYTHRYIKIAEDGLGVCVCLVHFAVYEIVCDITHK